MTAWSPKAAATEVCNGADDDCDGAVDESATGEPLSQTCANDCGQTGTETCTNGVWDGCTAPVLSEICGDNIDNDCNGLTDAPGCDNKPGVVGAEVSFVSTLGQVENLVTDHGDGTYSTWVRDLANPNQSGVAYAVAYNASSGSSVFSVSALAPVEVEVVSMRNALYAGAREARLAVQVRDVFGRPVPGGTEVVASFQGVGIAPGPASQGLCSTGNDGRCVLTWTAPDAVFDNNQVITSTVNVGGITLPAISIDVNKRADTLTVESNSVGMQLPDHPLFSGDTFSVPVYLNSTVTQAGSYDIHVSFNPAELQAVGVQAGTCGAFDLPVNNLIGGANPTGTLKFNAINIDPANGCAQSDMIHVANLSFKVLPGLIPDDPTSVSEMTILCKDAFGININALCSNKLGNVADPGGVFKLGVVRAWSRATQGILARAQDAQLLNWKSLTGLADATQLQVTAYRRDYSQLDVSSSTDTGYGSTDSAVASVSATGLVTAGDVPGDAVIAVNHLGTVSTAPVRTLTPQPLDVTLTDDDLQWIADAVTPGGVNLRQSAVLGAEVTWNQGLGVAWTQEVMPLFASLSQVQLPSMLAFDPVNREVFGNTPGDYSVSLLTPQGNPSGSNSITVSEDTPAACTGLTVVVPCEVELLNVSPPAPSVQEGATQLTARISAYLNAYQEQCQVQVYASYDDGSRERVTGTVGLSFESFQPTVASISSAGVITAQSAGTAEIAAAWTLSGTELCTGNASVQVDLPAPVAIDVTPELVTLAVDATDPASTVKGLPVSQQLTVTVHYADGSSQDFSNHSSVAYDAVTGDPTDLVSISNGGLLSATGNGVGNASVSVSSSLYPQLAPALAQVVVVEASGLSAEFYEAYTPTFPRVVEHTFSYIEGSSTRQDGTFEVILEFSDGSSADVTASPTLVLESLLAGTNIAFEGIVLLEPSTQRVTAGSPGSVDIKFSYGSLQYILGGVVVNSQQEGIVALTPTTASGATFTGIKDVGQTTVKAWATFNDGTRRRLYDSRFIPGLLQFASSVPTAATVNANGVATIHGNQSTVFSVGVAAAVDAGVPFDPPVELPVDCNLAAGCGDIDFGDTVGLAYKDREPGEVFTLEARVNTCDMALGAFDLEFHFDSTVVAITDVAAHGATLGAVFQANWLGEDGTMYANGIFNPLAGIKKGSDLPLFMVHLNALKGGSGVTSWSANLVTMVGLDAVTPVGPPTPRPGVAIVGDLDPACPSGALVGDVDGNCMWTVADVRLTQRLVAGLEPLTESMRKALVLSSDALPSAADVWRVHRIVAP